MYAQADPETQAGRLDFGDPVPLAQSVTVNVQKHSEGKRLLKVAWDQHRAPLTPVCLENGVKVFVFPGRG